MIVRIFKELENSVLVKKKTNSQGSILVNIHGYDAERMPVLKSTIGIGLNDFFEKAYISISASKSGDLPLVTVTASPKGHLLVGIQLEEEDVAVILDNNSNNTRPEELKYLFATWKNGKIRFTTKHPVLLQDQGFKGIFQERILEDVYLL